MALLTHVAESLYWCKEPSFSNLKNNFNLSSGRLEVFQTYSRFVKMAPILKPTSAYADNRKEILNYLGLQQLVQNNKVSFRTPIQTTFTIPRDQKWTIQKKLKNR